MSGSPRDDRSDRPGGSTSDEDRLARIALSHLVEPGDPRVSMLVADLGPAPLLAQVLAQHEAMGVELDAAARIGAHHPHRVMDRAVRTGLRFVVPGDDEWPEALGDLDHAEPVAPHGGSPVGLWVRGPARLSELTGSVAVVGARSATTYGTDLTLRLGSGLATAGRAVVSGAAFGIDQAAHRGALSGDGRTVAVLACGADRVYPHAHARLIEHLADEHAVVSETVPGGAPTRTRFLGRNRLIAALTAGTVVVEAAVRSGALNTANWAGRLHRHVMGVPGPVTSSLSAGVHQLLREDHATLVTDAAEVLETVSPAGENLTTRARAPERPRDRLGHRQRRVLDAVPVRRGAEVASLARTAGVGLVEVAGVLETLRTRGLVVKEGTRWRLADEEQLPEGPPFLDWTG